MFIQANLLNPEILLIILLLAVLIFGGSKIPELAKGLGQGMREFKSAMKEEPDAGKVDSDKNDADKPKPSV